MVATAPPTDIFAEQNYYELLGIVLDVDNKTGRIKQPTPEAVRRAWHAALREAHPGNNVFDDDKDFFVRKYRVVMEAGLCLGDLDRATEYHEAYVTVGHEKWAALHREPYTAEVLPDWIEVVVRDLLFEAQCLRGDFDDTASAMFALEVGDIPAYIPGERLAAVLDVQAQLDELIANSENLFRLRTLLADTGGIVVTWRKKHWSSKGKVVVGHFRKLSDRDRARLGDSEQSQPVAEITLALNYWLVADELERERVLYHELLHAQVESGKLKAVGHDVETFAAEVARYGLQTQEEAELVAAALSHPRTPELLEELGVLPDDQLVLFRRYFGEAASLRKTG